jgi:hypothetical protein
MSKKLTPWFPGDVKPARVGVYEKDLDDGVFKFSLWDGRKWRFCRESVGSALRQRERSAWQWANWRGLASEPKP